MNPFQMTLWADIGAVYRAEKCYRVATLDAEQPLEHLPLHHRDVVVPALVLGKLVSLLRRDLILVINEAIKFHLQMASLGKCLYTSS